MVQKHINQLFAAAIFIACGATIEAKLTTLKHFDPSPNYSANNSMMPPNSHFLDLRQARIKDEVPSKRRVFGINLSGFVQKAVRARGHTGTNEYGSVSGLAPNAFELGDFRGTMNAMGLFLGKNPHNGNVIYDNTTPTPDTSAAYVTPTTISNFNLSPCLSNIATGLIGSPTGATPTAPLFFVPVSTLSTAGNTGTSIFSERKLAQDNVYFGAFSLPIEYQQMGMRWEANVNCTDYIGLTVQSGISRMKQTYVNTILSSNVPGVGQTAVGPYSLSGIQNSPTSSQPATSSLYNDLNIGGAAAQTTTTATSAQALFNQYISNNIATILNPKCNENGINNSDPLCGFDDYSIDDVKIILSFKNVLEPFRYRHDDDDDTGSWPDMIFTPYAWVGGSFPVAKTTDYFNILSLPFGNNGHASVGGAAGMTFDFAESVEVGFEGGATYFFEKEEDRPFPTHRLQRILYPFTATVCTKPGVNLHFRALLNAYQFLKHVNFWMTYEIIEHRKDCFTVLSPTTHVDAFVPEVITCKSDWRAQFFNAGLSFDIQPGIQASLVWQQPISPRNAYYPVSIMGSINFMF